MSQPICACRSRNRDTLATIKGVVAEIRIRWRLRDAKGPLRATRSSCLEEELAVVNIALDALENAQQATLCGCQ